MAGRPAAGPAREPHEEPHEPPGQPRRRRAPAAKAVPSSIRGNAPAKSFEFIAAGPGGRLPPDIRTFIKSQVMRGRNTGKRIRRSAATTKSQTVLPTRNRAKKTATSVAVVPAAAASSASSYSSSSMELALRTPCCIQTRSSTSGDFSTTPTDYQDDVAVEEPEQDISTIERLVSSTYLSPLKSISDPSLFAFSVDKNDMGGLTHSHLYKFCAFFGQISFPLDSCFDVDSARVSWFHWAFQDPAFFHSALFTASSFQDLKRTAMADRASTVSLSYRSQLHLSRTLQLLQQRFQDPAMLQQDTTLAVVTALIMSSSMIRDDWAFDSHMMGLARLIQLRGGLKAFWGRDGNKRIHITICRHYDNNRRSPHRVHFTWYAKRGTVIDWLDTDVPTCPSILEQPSLDPSLQRPNVISHGIHTILQGLDAPLYDIFADLQSYAQVANRLTTSPEAKLKPQHYHTFMATFQRRLIRLTYSFDKQPVEATVRFGLLAFLLASMLALTRPVGPNSQFLYLSTQLRISIERLVASTPAAANLKLWLLMVGSVVNFPPDSPWLLVAVRSLTTGLTWSDVRRRMEDIMWIGALFDTTSRAVFEKSWL